MSQLEFFGPTESGRDDIWERFLTMCAASGAAVKLVVKFKEFHHKNPRIFEAFFRFSAEARQRRGKLSHWMIANRVRWYTAIETTGMDFKLSNDYIALYGRLVVATDPKNFEGFFEFKQMKKNRKGARE